MRKITWVWCVGFLYVREGVEQMFLVVANTLKAVYGGTDLQKVLSESLHSQVCVCVCVCVCVRVHVRAHVHARVCVCVSVLCVCLWYVCMYIRMCKCVHVTMCVSHCIQ